MDGVGAELERSSPKLLLDRLDAADDPRESCKVQYPLREALFLVTCANIAGCDDDEIALKGQHHLPFLHSYGEYHFETPEEDWLRRLINRVDPGERLTPVFEIIGKPARAKNGTLKTRATQFSHADAAALIDEALQKEKKTDALLSKIAQTVRGLGE